MAMAGVSSNTGETPAPTPSSELALSLLASDGIEASPSLKDRVKKVESEVIKLKGRTHDLEGWLNGATIAKKDLTETSSVRFGGTGWTLLTRIDSLEEEVRVLGVKVSGIDHRLTRFEEEAAAAAGGATETTDTTDTTATT